MFATTTLTAHRGATLVSREELASYEPAGAEGRWKPVKHPLIVDLMHEELARRDITVAEEGYAIQREGNYLFAALTTNWLNTAETVAAIAFRHSNDKTEAMKMYAGVHVFFCDNMALSGDEIILNRKHTTRLDVAAELTKAFDRYRDGTLVLQRNIEDLRAGPLSLGDAQCKLFEIFYRRLLPTRMLIRVTDSYLSTENRTDWGLLNALTLHAKNLPPNGNIRAPGHTHNWAVISGLERPIPMSAREKMPASQFKSIISALCERWHIPAYDDYLSKRYQPAFSRLDEAGQRAFWQVLGVREEQGTEDTHAVCNH